MGRRLSRPFIRPVIARVSRGLPPHRQAHCPRETWGPPEGDSRRPPRRPRLPSRRLARDGPPPLREPAPDSIPQAGRLRLGSLQWVVLPPRRHIAARFFEPVADVAYWIRKRTALTHRWPSTLTHTIERRARRHIRWRFQNFRIGFFEISTKSPSTRGAKSRACIILTRSNRSKIYLTSPGFLLQFPTL